MLSLQEMRDRTETQRRRIEHHMDASGYFDPTVDITNEGYPTILADQPAAVRRELIESLHAIPLHRFVQRAGVIAEFSADGLLGGEYLIPDKIYADIVMAADQEDLVPHISAVMVDGWSGGDLKIPVANRHSYRPVQGSSGGQFPMMEPTAGHQVTIGGAALQPFTIPLGIGTDLIDDAAFPIIERLLTHGAVAMADYANELAITVLKTATDGEGSVYTSATGDADETKYTGGTTADVLDAWDELCDGRHVGDTMIVTPEAWAHTISNTTIAGTMDGVAPLQLDERYDMKLSTLNLDVLFSTVPALHDPADLDDAAFTACVTIVFDRRAALATGRKRWARIEQYAHPWEDLAGAVLSARQDSATLHNDAVSVLTET